MLRVRPKNGPPDSTCRVFRGNVEAYYHNGWPLERRHIFLKKIISNLRAEDVKPCKITRPLACGVTSVVTARRRPLFEVGAETGATTQ